MNNAEIREAVELVEDWLNNGVIAIEKNAPGKEKFEMTNKEAVRILITLAESYLEIKGMPEERATGIAYRGKSAQELDEEKGFNSALHLCKLAMLKKCEGLEKVIGGVVRTIPIMGNLDRTQGLYMNDKAIKEVSTAVRNHLLGGKG